MNELTPNEREFWNEEAARWAIRQEDYERYASEAYEKRQQALRRLGMITINTEQRWLGNE